MLDTLPPFVNPAFGTTRLAEDPVEATRVVHECEGTFGRRLTEDGKVVLLRV
jgi:hypothetical protein